MPLRLQADATAATSRCYAATRRCHCGYKQIPLRLQADATATTNRCCAATSRYHCGYKQIPLRREADATAATSSCHCGYKQMPMRLHTVNKTTNRPNIRHHSCPTSLHTLYSRSSSPRRMIRPVSTLMCSSQRASLFALPSVRCFHSYAESYAETYAALTAQICVNSPIVDIDVLFECSPGARRRLQMHHPQRLLPDNVRHGPRSSHGSAPLAGSRSPLQC